MSPITPVSARNMPPLVSLMATITASVLRPRMSPPNQFATARAKSVAVPTFAVSRPIPRISIRGAARIVIFVPTVKRYIPSMVG